MRESFNIYMLLYCPNSRLCTGIGPRDFQEKFFFMNQVPFFVPGNRVFVFELLKTKEDSVDFWLLTSGNLAVVL
jgi:hypothetical protein